MAQKLTVLQAFARMEGFGVPGNRPTRNHDPLDIEWGPFARAHGALHIEIMPAGSKLPARFAYFPDDATGFAAARDLLLIPAKFRAGVLVEGYLGATLRQILPRFAPPSENDTAGYLRSLCDWTGLTPDTVLTQELLK